MRRKKRGRTRGNTQDRSLLPENSVEFNEGEEINVADSLAEGGAGVGVVSEPV